MSGIAIAQDRRTLPQHPPPLSNASTFSDQLPPVTQSTVPTAPRPAVDPQTFSQDASAPLDEPLRVSLSNQKPALEPTGHPGLPEKDPRLPPPQEGVPQEIRIISSEQFFVEGNVLKVRGAAHVQYRGYDIYAREVDHDRSTNVMVLRGGAQLIGKDSIILGETITVDFNAETFRAQKTAAEVRPGLLQGRTLDNVYLIGGEVWGSEREIFGHNCGLTTCVYEKPHYLLDARDLNLRPRKRIILRDVRVEILGHTVLKIPFLSIPLDHRRERYTPEVGHTPQEGYYIKSKWGIPIAGPNSLDANVDYFEKLGPGLGGIFRYSASQNEGYMRAYGLTGRNTLELQQGHKQLFGNNLFQIENNYQQRNFLNAPQNTILTTRASMTFPQRARDTSRISFYRSTNESATFQSTSQTISLSDTRAPWERMRTSLDVAWVRSESRFTSGGSEREQVDVRFKGTQDLRSLLAELEYQRSIPVGDTNNFFSASDKTPVLTLRSDSTKLFGRDFKFPFQTDFSIGEFVDPREKDQITRTNFDIRSNYNSPRNSPFTYTLNGRFKQSFYSDDTAQFAVGYGAQASYALGPDTALTARYNFLEPEGFTPLSIDRIGRTNLITTDLSYRPFKPFLIGLQTGYDFLLVERRDPTAWQPVGLRMEWTPKDWFQLRALPVYDPFNRLWSSIRVDMTYIPGATYVSLGARYDGFRKVWGATNIFIDGLKWGRTKMSALLSYNGYLKKFEERHVSFIYDLHCAEAVLQVRESNVGFRSGREVYFFVRIKAFPFDTPFGLTRRGAPIGTATGR